MPSLTLPPNNSKKWSFSPAGELIGILWYAKNIDPRNSFGKLRLAERVKVLYDQTDNSEFDQDARAFTRTNADGTDRYWGMIRATDNATGALWRTTDNDPTNGWAEDSQLSFPFVAKDSMDTFLRVGGYDRLVVPTASGDLAMLNNGNARSLNIASSTDATPIKITTATPHGLATGDQVTVAGHLLNTNANGTRRIIRISATEFTLNGSTATGAGAGGASGTVATGKWLNSWWRNTLGQAALDSNYPVVARRFNKIFLVGNSNYVHVITPSADGTVTSSANVAYQRLVFPDGYYVNCIVVTPTKSWIILNNSNGGDAIAAPWNGGEETYEDPMKLYDRFALSAEILDGIPWIVNGKGQILAYNGASFQEMHAFPVFYSGKRWTDQSSVSALPGVLHRNGMRVIDGQIHMLVKAVLDGSAATLLEQMPAGIWVIDKDLGLYCKYTLGQHRATNNDWGARILASVGALIETTIEKGRFLAAATYYSDNQTTSKAAIHVSETSSTADYRGHFVTVQLQGQQAGALWKDLIARFKRLANSTDAIIIKARTEISATRTFKHFEISWTSTTTFTSTDAALANAVEGDEIEILVGKGAGATAHISTIVLVGSTYTVTLDEAIPNVSGTAKAALNNFEKLGSITDQSISNKILQISRYSPWVELKGELRGTTTSPELEELEVSSETSRV